MSDEVVQDVQVEEAPEWKIKLQNFQSIISGEISVPNGLTIVTGNTNSGKTAFLRAANCAIFNTGSDDMVRAGTKIAGVTISNGRHTMIYCRNAQGKNEKTAYQFDGGTVQKKVGRAQLPEVIQMFGIREVRMQNGIKMKLNFWNQGEKPFLTDCTAGQLYEFLSLSSCDKYVKVLKQMVTDIKVQEAEINNCNVKIDTLKVINNHKQDYIDKNKDFDDVYSRTIVASDKANKLNANLESLSGIQVLSGDIQDTKVKLSSTTEKLEKIDDKGVSDRYNHLIELNDLYSDMYELLCEIKQVQDSIKSTKSLLKDVSDRYDILSKSEKSLSKKVQQFSEDANKYKVLFNMSEECQRDKSDIDDIKNRIMTLDSNSIDIDGVSADMDRLLSLDASYKVIDDIVKGIIELKSGIKEVSSNIKDTEDKLKESEDELEAFKLEVGYCPYCGSVFCEH